MGGRGRAVLAVDCGRVIVFKVKRVGVYGGL